MTSDDQYFLDLLSSIPQDVARYGNILADFIEKQVDSLAAELKGMAGQIDKHIDRVRRPEFIPPPPPKSFIEKTQHWISEHRTAVAIAVAFTGTTVFLIHRRRRLERKKRRAKRTQHGAKKEVVVLSSNIHDPLARSLALDLERRGYIVFVTVSSQAEEDLVNSEARADVRSLWMDLSSSVPNPTVDIHPNLVPIQELVSKTHHQSRANGLQPLSYQISLSGLIVMPAFDYTRAPLTSLPSSDLIDTVNTRLLSPMLTIQQFLPLLKNASNPSSIIVAYPSVPQSLTPPLQTIPSATTSALSHFTRSLRSEIHLTHPRTAQPVQVTELKLGNIDLGTTREIPPPNTSSPSRSQAALTWHWHSSQRASQIRKSFNQQLHGSPLRVFHNAVFDTLYSARSLKPASQPTTWGSWILGLSLSMTDNRPGGSVYAGRGAWIYDHLVQRVHPRGLVDWCVRMRLKREGWGSEDGPSRNHGVGGDPVYTVGVRGASSSSRSGSARSGSDNGRMETSGIGGESAVWEKV